MTRDIVTTADIEPTADIETDPVCGAVTDVELARSADLVTTYAERTYAFCGAACRDRFLAQPTRYAASGRSEP